MQKLEKLKQKNSAQLHRVEEKNYVKKITEQTYFQQTIF